MPHHMEDLERQIPYSLEKTWSQIPGICPGGGGVLKFRIDRYIIHLGSIMQMVRMTYDTQCRARWKGKK
jgi:hypothetical protein